MDPILFELQENVAIIKLNRPSVFNSFNREMALMLQEKLKACEQDNEVRAIFLTGEGKAFCAGQDLQEVTDPNGPELEKVVREHYNPIVMLLRSIEKPIVCAVNGVAAGAGANIALACDITIAAYSANFIQAFSKIGLIPDSGGTFTLPRLIGIQRATAAFMLAEKISAQEAEKMGMIYKAFGDEEFAAEAFKVAIQLSKMPTLGLGLTKRALNESLFNNFSDQLDVEEELQTMAGKTMDYAEGVNAFLEKRKPNFIGK